MRFTPTATLGGPLNFPVSGALYRFEPGLYGDQNASLNNITGSFVSGSVSTDFITDPTASVLANNVVSTQFVGIENLTTGSNFGTVIWVWRYQPQESISPKVNVVFDYLFDFRDGAASPDRGIEDGYINLNYPSPGAPDIGNLYISSSMYNAYGNEDLQKFEINADNLAIESIEGLYNTGSQSFPGYWNNTITGSNGLVNSQTGSNAYRFTAFSPNTAVTASGDVNGKYKLALFGNDNIPANPDGSWTYGQKNINPNSTYPIFYIAAISVFNKVLNDDEVRDVFSYYTGSLGLEIGL